MKKILLIGLITLGGFLAIASCQKPVKFATDVYELFTN
jgi:hypothetical protein